MNHSIYSIVDGTFDRLLQGMALVPVFLGLVVLAIAVLWWLGERRFR